MEIKKSYRYILTLIIVLFFVCGTNNTFAQNYVPLIGISSVPEPLALPKGAGNVTYNYAVKNFLREMPLTDVQVTDDKCSPVKFTEGDDNKDGKLDYSETWRFTCTTKLSVTTQSIATAIGVANNLPAAHKAYTTVVVGKDIVAPLVNIINITKVAYPLTLPSEGGDITFTYRVNNPGVVPLSDVSVTDDKCSAMSKKLGDTNGNNLLDITEVWVYTCTTHLSQTTTNTATVNSYANGLKAVGYVTLTVTVNTPNPSSIPSLPNTGTEINFKIIVWGILTVILAMLTIFFFFKKNKQNYKQNKLTFNGMSKKIILITIFFLAIFGTGYYFLFSKIDRSGNTTADNLFGWKFPITKFPPVGSGDNQLAYSSIRDPGGIPEGLPVRLKIPIIDVNSAIEDALITPDGRMDVPSGSVNVAWFALGPSPGETGSAVIGGHFGIRNGYKFVFYDLDKLKVGDKVYIENDKGETLTFQVRRIKLFDRNADATTVFTSNDGLAHLNLITCEGIWNRVDDSYPDRRVVFTDLIPTEDVIAINTTKPQKTVIEPKLPPTNITITPVEVVLNQEETIKIPTTEPISNSQNFIQSTKNLFATPLDTLITLLLFISIFFVSSKIIKQAHIH